MKINLRPYSFHKTVLAISFLLTCGSYAKSFGATPPPQPSDAVNPGSAVYSYEFNKLSFSEAGRTVDVFIPVNKNNPNEKFPVIAYGHGQAIGLSAYELTFVHLAKKGIAVVFPQYDTGFWDQDWRRMADDYNRLVQVALTKYSQLDASQVIFSGHSKGAYIGLMASGAPSSSALPPKSVLVFTPAGFDAQYLKSMNPQTPLTVVWGDRDNIISQSSVRSIYDQSPSVKKQFIEVASYQGLPADHYLVMSDSTFFGGRKGVSAHHYFGAWKWMWGAVKEDAYLYGDEASSTGAPDLKHKILKNY